MSISTTCGTLHSGEHETFDEEDAFRVVGHGCAQNLKRREGGRNIFTQDVLEPKLILPKQILPKQTLAATIAGRHGSPLTFDLIKAIVTLCLCCLQNGQGCSGDEQSKEDELYTMSNKKTPSAVKLEV